jgi:hypothetical protein
MVLNMGIIFANGVTTNCVKSEEWGIDPLIRCDNESITWKGELK